MQWNWIMRPNIYFSELSSQMIERASMNSTIVVTVGAYQHPFLKYTLSEWYIPFIMWNSYSNSVCMQYCFHQNRLYYFSCCAHKYHLQNLIAYWRCITWNRGQNKVPCMAFKIKHSMVLAIPISMHISGICHSGRSLQLCAQLAIRPWVKYGQTVFRNFPNFPLRFFHPCIVFKSMTVLLEYFNTNW